MEWSHISTHREKSAALNIDGTSRKGRNVVSGAQDVIRSGVPWKVGVSLTQASATPGENWVTTLKALQR